jgi:hypothetical protein
MSLQQNQSTLFEIAGPDSRFDQIWIIIAPTAPITTIDIDYEINFKE